MARRDRRRGGDHSAPRNAGSPPPSSPAEGAADDPPGLPAQPVPDGPTQPEPVRSDPNLTEATPVVDRLDQPQPGIDATVGAEVPPNRPEIDETVAPASGAVGFVPIPSDLSEPGPPAASEPASPSAADPIDVTGWFTVPEATSQPGVDAPTSWTPAGVPEGEPARSSGGAMSAAELLAPDAAAAAGVSVAMTRKELRKASQSKSKGKAKPAGASRPGGKPAKKKAKRSWLDRLLLTGVVVVALALVAMGSGFAYLQYRFHQVTKVTVRHLRVAPVGQPFNVLLIGSDSRAGESAAAAEHFGSAADTGGQRSDVVKIVHIVPATGQANVLSIPRDTMVSVAGDTTDTGRYNRINATYNTGPDQLVQTIENDFGIPIEHVVQVNFEGLNNAVYAIGGIYLNFPYPAKDAYTGLNIPQTGCQLVEGGYALALARSRHYEYYKDGYWQYDGTSDFGRIQRQNAFLKAVINQAETKYNPLTLNAFIGSVVQGVTVDSTFTVSDLISLAREFHTFSSQSLGTATLPTYSEASSEFSDLGDVLYVQQPQAQQVITQFLGGPPETALTPPPGPEGVVPTTTTTIPTATTYEGGGTTPPTSSSTSTTTTIETDFDPTPCSPAQASP